MTELARAKRNYVAIKYFCVATKFDLGWSFYVATEYSYVMTEFGLDRRVYVTTENLMSRQSCLSSCRNRVYLASR